MLRKYALVIFDDTDKIIDKFAIDIATDATNNGFKLNMSTITSNIEDIITQITQEKQQVIFTVQQVYDSYIKANSIAQWIEKYSRPEYTMALQYDDTNIIRYCIGKVTTLKKDERTAYTVLPQQLVFTQTTPWFLKQENILIFVETTIGKKYPYKYPYQYGASRIENNLIENTYIYSLPLTISIDGAISNPTVSLVSVNDDGTDGEVYNTVQFTDDFNILSNQKLVIDGAKRKITLYTYSDAEKTRLVETEDVTNKADESGDLFLRAEFGKSKILYSGVTDENFKMVGSWRQYIL